MLASSATPEHVFWNSDCCCYYLNSIPVQGEGSLRIPSQLDSSIKEKVAYAFMQAFASISPGNVSSLFRRCLRRFVLAGFSSIPHFSLRDSVRYYTVGRFAGGLFCVSTCVTLQAPFACIPTSALHRPAIASKQFLFSLQALAIETCVTHVLQQLELPELPPLSMEVLPPVPLPP